MFDTSDVISAVPHRRDPKTPPTSVPVKKASK